MAGTTVLSTLIRWRFMALSLAVHALCIMSVHRIMHAGWHAQKGEQLLSLSLQGPRAHDGNRSHGMTLSLDGSTFVQGALAQIGQINGPQGGTFAPQVLDARADGYKMNILRRIYHNKYYPLRSRHLNHEGTVRIAFTIDRYGNLVGPARIMHGCRHEDLNRAGQKAIDLSNPFPPLPDSIRDASVTFLVDMDFRLND